MISADLKNKIMTEREKIEIEILEELLEDIKGMHPEYIAKHIEEQIDIIKHGI